MFGRNCRANLNRQLSFKISIQEKDFATPGVGFGKHGEGFMRFALTVDSRVLKEATDLL